MVNFFDVKKDEVLSKHCSFKVGGKADIYFEPKNIDDFVRSIKYCKKNDANFFILGNGTNTIFTDKGYRGSVICTKKLCNVTIKKDIVCAECGVNMLYLNKLLKDNCLGGFEWSYGIPGTLGGAVCMNAGAYGDEIKNYVLKAKVFDGKKTYIMYSNELEMEYRNSVIKRKNLIVLKVWLKFKKLDKTEIEKLQNENFAKRLKTQPLSLPNAGSIFKKCNGISAGKIIEDAGLKGVCVKNAQVSKVHANFIVNLGGAKCEDVLNLIEIISNKVYNNTGIILEKEVLIIGEI